MDTPAARQRIFIVDDEPTLAESLRLGLEREDREVLASRSFEDARRRLLAEHFDVLITDVRLGAFNGIQLAVIARSHNPGIRIIVFSGFDDPVLREEAKALDATYLVKPVGAEQMNALINER